MCVAAKAWSKRRPPPADACNRDPERSEGSARSSARHVPLRNRASDRFEKCSFRVIPLTSFFASLPKSIEQRTRGRSSCGAYLLPAHPVRAEDRARSFTSFRMTEKGLTMDVLAPQRRTPWVESRRLSTRAVLNRSYRPASTLYPSRKRFRNRPFRQRETGLRPSSFGRCCAILVISEIESPTALKRTRWKPGSATHRDNDGPALGRVQR